MIVNNLAIAILSCCIIFKPAHTMQPNLPTPPATQTITQQKTPHRLAIYCDTLEAETKDNDKRAITFSLAQNIFYKASCILTSASLFNIFINEQETDSILKNFDYQLGTWEIFHVNNSSYYLLVPHENDGQIPDITQAFNTSNLTAVPQNEKNLTAIKTFIQRHLRSPTNLSTTLPLIFNSLDSIQHTIDQNTPITQETRDHLLSELLPWNIFICGHGNTNTAIAGLETDDLSVSLDFFNTALNTQFILISSCFIAGENQLFMSHKKTLAADLVQKELRYKLAIAGSAQASTTGVAKDLANPDPSMNIKKFFEELETPATSVIAPKTSTTYGNLTSPKKQYVDPFEKALQYCTVPDDWYSRYLGINSIPQVLIPRVGWSEVFTSLPLVDIVTEPKLAKATEAPTNNTYLVKDTLALIVKPTTIQIPLSIMPCKKTKQPAWFDQEWRNVPASGDTYSKETYYPTFISPSSGEHFHIINTINVLENEYESLAKGILKFLRDSFLNVQGRTQPICWVIQNLTGMNDFDGLHKGSEKIIALGVNNSLIAALQGKTTITLNQVVVCTYAKKTKDSEALAVFILFKYESTWYCMNNDNIKKGNGSVWFFESSPTLDEQKLTTIETLIGTKQSLKELIATQQPQTSSPNSTTEDNQSVQQKSLSNMVATMQKLIAARSAPDKDTASSNAHVDPTIENNNDPVTNALTQLKTKLTTLKESLASLKLSLKSLNDEVVALLTGSLSSAAKQTVLTAQEKHKSECVALINGWKKLSDYNTTDLTSFINELAFLSKKQSRYLAPLMQRELSKEQLQKLVNLMKTQMDSFLTTQSFNALTNYAHIIAKISSNPSQPFIVNCYNKLYEQICENHLLNPRELAHQEAAKNLFNVLYTEFYKTILNKPPTITEFKAQQLHAAIQVTSPDKAETILNTFALPFTDKEKLIIFNALINALAITNNQTQSPFFNLYPLAITLYLNKDNANEDWNKSWNNFAKKIYNEWESNFSKIANKYFIAPSKILFGYSLATFFLYCDYGPNSNTLTFVEQLIKDKILPLRLTITILKDITRRHAASINKPKSSRYETLVNNLTETFNQLLPKSGTATSFTCNNGTVYVYADCEQEVAITQLVNFYVTFIPLANPGQLEAIKDWLLHSLFKASPAVKDLLTQGLQADALMNIVRQYGENTSPNLTTLYEAFKNSQCIELKNLINSYSTWGGYDSDLDQNIKAIARAIEKGTNQS